MSSLPSFPAQDLSSRDLVDRSRPARLDTPVHHLPHSISNGPAPPRPTRHLDTGSGSSVFDNLPLPELPGRPQHARSMSHPFPPLSNGKKNRQDYPAGFVPRIGAASNDVQMMNQTTSHAHRRGGPTGSKDFATGNCMTCASLMRWPKDLKVFKCTICLTINDLVPISRATKPNVGPTRDWSQNHFESSPTTPPSRGRTLSLEHTRRIVRQCLHSYISKRLAHTSPQPSERPLGFFDQSSPRRDDPSTLGVHSYTPSASVHPAHPTSHDIQGFGSQTIRNEDLALHQPPGRKPANAPRPKLPSQSERLHLQTTLSDNMIQSRRQDSSSANEDDPRRVFKQLEDYIVDCFGSFDCINHSFAVNPPRTYPKQRSGSISRKPVSPKEVMVSRPKESIKTETPIEQPVCTLDPRTLLLGDIAENGTWWTGGQNSTVPPKVPANPTEIGSPTSTLARPPHINWKELEDWYMTVINTAESWLSVYEDIVQSPSFSRLTDRALGILERDVLLAQEHVHRILLKSTEMLLKRPGRPISDPGDIRFLPMLVDNPLLHAGFKPFRGFMQSSSPSKQYTKGSNKMNAMPASGILSGQHTGLVKRIVGLLSNLSVESHNYIISWVAKFHLSRFVRIKDLISGFLTYRMLRQNEKKQQDAPVDITAGLIPQMQTGRSGAYLYEEIGTSSSAKKPKEQPKKSTYMDDWQVKAACRVLALLFAANNLSSSRRSDEWADSPAEAKVNALRDGVHTSGQILPTSDFYNSMIDNVDLVADYEAWESKRNCFSFCQYPFLLSIWAKTQVLEHDARRQMQMKARDAWFESIMNQKNTTQFLSLNVRRDCLVEDSLTAVGEVIGSGGEDVKKRLRIAFKGEEGIDAGGLRKEWFLLLIREVFNPDHGMFVYDEDSQFCYFNPNSFETSDQFYLVGVVMGLAIYNSTILDVALPPVAFRKLLASAPAASASAHPKPALRYTLEDLAEYQPRLARGLRQLLDFDGDVETTFCLDFVVENAKYGTTVQIPLCPNGERKPVTNSNRREYVDLYVRHILDTSVTRQFEPFKRGFYTVCGGNAFSLFRPEEIELLVRGSDEPLDIASLRVVADYDGWATKKPDGSEPVIDWFWDSFQQATPNDQRKMLLFITGSDRIPATGATTLHIKLSCLGEDCDRYPIARTCFNLLSLWRYNSRRKLEAMLWRAVRESEGFGLK
ncbi:putative E3 ubiquitin-protein ligase mug30 [Paramyrothecium foliicola]|nr:putative E3 ubiquitin-protein ligase mug30 [Paramyrothecium foliicola]